MIVRPRRRCSALANAVDMPVRQAFSVEMVGREDIGNAVALNSAMFNGARVIGPAVAGLTIGAFGVAAAFAHQRRRASSPSSSPCSRCATASCGSPPDRAAAPRSAPSSRTCARACSYVRRTPLVLLAVAVVGSWPRSA